MTECERIIENGIVSPDFLKPETICDFYVDEKRKKVWSIGIDLLVKLDQICRKHNLQYSVAFGSLLGIIRHQGFIPWDDDIDVVMPREDYEKLRLLKCEFEEPYFLQYPGDDGYLFSFAKLRNSNTTSISKPFRYESFNQGHFLDIFPLDNFCATNIEENINRIKRLIAECSAIMRSRNPFPDEIDHQKLALFSSLREGRVVVNELEDILTQHNSHPSTCYTAWCCVMYDYKRMTFNMFCMKRFSNIGYIQIGEFVAGTPKEFESAIESLQADNRSIIDGFQLAGEPVTVIEEDYEKTIQLLLESQNGA